MSLMKPSPSWRLALLALAFGWSLAACDAARPVEPVAADPEPPSVQDAAFSRLWDYEAQQHAGRDFTHLSPSQSGADPFALTALPDAKHLVGVLRGADQVVLLDADTLHVLHRASTPAGPVAVVTMPDGSVVVAAEGADALVRFEVNQGTLVQSGTWALPQGSVVRDLAVGRAGVLYSVDERSGKVVARALGDAGAVKRQEILGQCRGPTHVRAAGSVVAVNCLLEHTLNVWAVGDDGFALKPQAPLSVTLDGPMWSLAARADADGKVWLVAGGVENRPLDRSDGAFGFIDSFVFAWTLESGALKEVVGVNVSEHGVITPRWLGLEASSQGQMSAFVTGYGGDKAVRLPLGGGAPTVGEALPGVVSAVSRPGGGWTAASALLEGWVTMEPGAEATLVGAGQAGQGEARDVAWRTGELLFFTHLMAPWNATEGRRSRFTCETCHFEGYVDGRTHFTGRGEVYATTKPLVGLMDNRPHFTRALDKTMVQMVFNEFRVANKHSGHDAWFEVDAQVLPWLKAVDGLPQKLEPEFLRRALMAFLMGFDHKPNPAVRGRKGFKPLELRGARLFEQRCAGCHAARLVADDPDSAVDFEHWEAAIFAHKGPIVWARDGYEKTGVEPYVHDDGARPTSLRRLYKKWPYLTNGSARSLESLLESVSWDEGGRFYHASAPEGATGLEPEQRAALRAFLELL